MSGDGIVLYSSLLRRMQAALIDSFVVIILMAILLSLFVSYLPGLPGVVRILIIFSPLLFLEPLMLSLWGGTLGYWLFNQVVTRNGTDEYLSLFRALGRYLIKVLFGWLSLIFMFTTKRHQALHDLFADSVVTLRDTSRAAAPDGHLERSDEAEAHASPSPTRRTVLILVYLTTMVALLAAGFDAVVSPGCIERGLCGGYDRAVVRLAALLLFAGASAVIVLGWRGKLLGCRRRPLD